MWQAAGSCKKTYLTPCRNLKLPSRLPGHHVLEMEKFPDLSRSRQILDADELNGTRTVCDLKIKSKSTRMTGNSNYSADRWSTLHDGCIFVVKLVAAWATSMTKDLSAAIWNPAFQSPVGTIPSGRLSLNGAFFLQRPSQAVDFSRSLMLFVESSRSPFSRLPAVHSSSF